MASATSTSDNDIIQATTGYVKAKDAYDLDVELMQQPGYTLEQLMELAGLSCAEAMTRIVATTTRKRDERIQPCSILVVCGPGNNGGDGLVAARHLVLFGYKVVVVYPKRSSKQPHYANLVKQCEDFDIPVLDELPSDLSEFDGMMDAIFGFSFQGVPREPFQSILSQMMEAQTSHGIPILSVDVPSGWHVDDGDIHQSGFAPTALISLTAPKPCAAKFQGRHHFVGGRFLPPALAERYGIRMPPYTGLSQVYELTDGYTARKEPESSSSSSSSSYDWRADYASYCAEQESKQLDSAAATTIAVSDTNEPDAREKPAASTVLASKADSSEEKTWEEQYAQYLAEKAAKERTNEGTS